MSATCGSATVGAGDAGAAVAADVLDVAGQRVRIVTEERDTGRVLDTVVADGEAGRREVLVAAEDVVAVAAEDRRVGVALVRLADDRLRVDVGRVVEEDRVGRIGHVERDEAEVPVRDDRGRNAVDDLHPDVVVEDPRRRAGLELVEVRRPAESSRAHR